MNYQYFNDILSIETAVYDILEDLISNNCLTSKSQVIDLEGDISINLTLDGITYFDDVKERNSAVIFNVSGGQVNIAKDNGKIDAIMGNTEPQKERKKIDVPIDNVYRSNESTSGTGKKVFISYSWVPGSNKEWVRKLAQKLEQDGVEVVIDYKDLRLGHDKYAFMESLPNYLASRMYADLTDFNMGYGELLSNILGENRKDIIGKSTSNNTMDIDDFDSPNPFFEYRFGKVFPGLRGVKEFDNPKECVDRLEVLLRNPLNKNKENMNAPIWWLRGSSSNEISSFERLDSVSFLMDVKQL